MIGLSIDVERAKIIASRFRSKGKAVRDAIKDATQKFVDETVEYIRANKLSGDPLHYKTGRLYHAVFGTVEVQNGDVIGQIGVAGSKAPYWKVHEYGGSFLIPELQRVSIRGKLHSVRSHVRYYPERSFIRSSLAEVSSRGKENILSAAEEAAKA